MPTYCYRDEDGKVYHRFFHAGEAPASIVLNDDSTAKRAFDEEFGSIGVPASSGWPLECVASGVNPNQAQELRDHFQKVGVPTEVSSDGNPIYRNAAHRKKALKARGFVDKGSYS